MEITLRTAEPKDAEVCGAICFDAFKNIADQHGFPPDFPSREVGAQFIGALIANPGFHGIVAERDGKIVGSNFLDERSSIVGLGPITVDPAAQDGLIGRRLMVHAMERTARRGAPGLRLVQSAYHNRSLALYTKLGFEVRGALSNLQGPALDLKIPGYTVRPARAEDASACNDLCLRIHGHHRGGELDDAIKQGSAKLVEHDGRVTGYATGIGFSGHAVGESNNDLKALVGAAENFPDPGFIVPSGNGELMRWCLGHDLKIVQQLTLMSTGLYAEPNGVFLPSILY